MDTQQPQLQDPAEQRASAPRVFPLSAITDRVKEILRPASAKSFWVRAEIVSGRESGGSFYCDLIEAGPDGTLVAKLRCSIWSQDLRRLRRKFDEQGIELQLADGTSVVLCCQLQYSGAYGLSLKVVDADPVFALGDIERKKQLILEGLRKDGLLEPNKRLPVPTIPRRIGLITSKGSAAFHDFVQTLRVSGYGFSLVVADAVVQGKGAELAVLKGLASLAQAGLDLVVIIRGGGSKSDLSWLDNDAIARAIAGYPLPVWTGIGHEIDVSVLDHVSNRMFKTPTALAEELVARCVAADRYLEESADRLQTIWQYRLERDCTWIDRAEVGIRNGVRKLLETTRARLREVALTPLVKVGGRLSDESRTLAEAGLSVKRGGLDLLKGQKNWLDERGERLKTRSMTLLETAKKDQQTLSLPFHPDRLLQRIERDEERLEARLATVSSYDPDKQLKRGYALLRNAQGQILTGIAGVRVGEQLVAQSHDGRLGVEVQKVEIGKK